MKAFGTEARIRRAEKLAATLLKARADLARLLLGEDEPEREARRVPVARRVVVLERAYEKERERLAEPGGAPRPEVALYEQGDRVDRQGYGAVALGGSIHRVKSLSPRQVRTATAYAALAEFADASGGGGPQLGERVDLPAGRDGSAARLRALEAKRLVDRAEIAAICLGDLAAAYGVRRLPLDLRAAARALVLDERSGGRRPIGRLELMRGVCLHGLTLAAILERAGWSVNNETRRIAGRALGEALDAVDLEWGGAQRRVIGNQDVSVVANGDCQI